MTGIPDNLTDLEKVLWKSSWEEESAAHAVTRELLVTVSRERERAEDAESDAASERRWADDYKRERDAAIGRVQAVENNNVEAWAESERFRMLRDEAVAERDRLRSVLVQTRERLTRANSILGDENEDTRVGDMDPEASYIIIETIAVIENVLR